MRHAPPARYSAHVWDVDLMCIKTFDRCLLDCSRMDDLFLLLLAARLAEEAGAEVLALRARGYKTAEKPDRSPVTDADIASQRIILAGLRSAAPDVPVIAEESPSATGAHLRFFWLVDPLDAHENLPPASTSLSSTSGTFEMTRWCWGLLQHPPSTCCSLGSSVRALGNAQAARIFPFTSQCAPKRPRGTGQPS